MCERSRIRTVVCCVWAARVGELGAGLGAQWEGKLSLTGDGIECAGLLLADDAAENCSVGPAAAAGAAVVSENGGTTVASEAAVDGGSEDGAVTTATSVASADVSMYSGSGCECGCG